MFVCAEYRLCMRYILIDKDEYKMNNIRYAADAHALERSLASPVAPRHSLRPTESSGGTFLLEAQIARLGLFNVLNQANASTVSQSMVFFFHVRM